MTMTKLEREAAERAIQDLAEVEVQLENAYKSCQALEVFHRWCLEYDCILRVCTMQVSRIAQDIKDAIAAADKQEQLRGEKQWKRLGI